MTNIKGWTSRAHWPKRSLTNVPTFLSLRTIKVWLNEAAQMAGPDLVDSHTNFPLKKSRKCSLCMPCMPLSMQFTRYSKKNFLYQDLKHWITSWSIGWRIAVVLGGKKWTVTAFMQRHRRVNKSETTQQNTRVEKQRKQKGVTYQWAITLFDLDSEDPPSNIIRKCFYCHIFKVISFSLAHIQLAPKTKTLPLWSIQWPRRHWEYGLAPCRWMQSSSDCGLFVTANATTISNG